MPSWRAGRDAGWLPDRGAHCALSPDHPAVLTRVRAQLVVQVREEQGSRRLHRPLPCPRLPGTGSPGPPPHSDVSLGPRAQSEVGEKKGRLIPDVPSWGSRGSPSAEARAQNRTPSAATAHLPPRCGPAASEPRVPEGPSQAKTAGRRCCEEKAQVQSGGGGGNRSGTQPSSELAGDKADGRSFR